MKYGLLVILFVVHLKSFNQVNFLAYQVSGHVTYKDNNQFHALKIGKLVPENTEIQVAENSKVLMICENTSGIITLIHGTHRLIDYKANCVLKEFALSQSYFAFVWWQLTTPNISPEDERKKLMSMGGGVYRGCAELDFNPLFDTLNLFTEPLVINWTTREIFNTVELTLKEFVLYEYENSLTPIYKDSIAGISLNLNPTNKEFTPMTEYFWAIKISGEEKCTRKLVRIWGKEQYLQLIDSLRHPIPAELDESEKNYMTGYLLEKNKFFGEAFMYYRLAVKGQPENVRYRNSLDRLINMTNSPATPDSDF